MVGKEHPEGKLKKWLLAPRNREIILAIAVVAVVLLGYQIWNNRASPSQTTMANASPAPSGSTDTTDTLQAQLERVLSGIAGAGQVDVLITYSSDGELVPAMSSSVQRNETNETGENGQQSQTITSNEQQQPLTATSGGQTAPIILEEKKPPVQGVVVVAEGAGDVKVRMQLQSAVKTALDIPLDHIEVFPMQTTQP